MFARGGAAAHGTRTPVLQMRPVVSVSVTGLPFGATRKCALLVPWVTTSALQRGSFIQRRPFGAAPPLGLGAALGAGAASLVFRDVCPRPAPEPALSILGCALIDVHLGIWRSAADALKRRAQCGH